MRLISHLSQNSIMLDIAPADKWELIKIMSRRIADEESVSSQGIRYDDIYSAMYKREMQSSTGIGNGFAFPHARMSNIRNLAVIIAVLREELDFDSVDKRPVKIVCMILTPEKKPTMSLKVMSLVAKLFSDKKAEELIYNASEPGAVLDCIRDSELDLDVSIIARDIMRDLLFEVNPEMPLRELTPVMSSNHVNAVPVVNGDKKLLGEITCAQLFHIGIPNFFTQLKSVAFISEFDPFEKYFFEESRSKAIDVMSEKFCSMPPEATLLEIVFALTVLNYSNVYVVENERLIGVVDQSTLLDQVINI